MTTPEGKVKAKVKRILAKFSHYGLWPVPSGYGESTLDYIGCFHGNFFSCETKKPGGKLTARQELIAQRMRDAGGRVFIIDGDTSELEHWLDAVQGQRNAPGEIPHRSGRGAESPRTSALPRRRQERKNV
jgi:hypothetical protein